jgi:cytochrome o ubiquinol oxidase subunit IV
MKEHASIKSYLIGFILSIVLTIVAYLLVQTHIFSSHQVLGHELLIFLLLTLALIQLIVQLFFFLHLGREPQPRWNLIFFISTIGIVLLVVIGSLWIMNHLNYNMMPQDMEKFLLEDEGIHRSE